MCVCIVRVDVCRLYEMSSYSSQGRNTLCISGFHTIFLSLKKLCFKEKLTCWKQLLGSICYPHCLKVPQKQQSNIRKSEDGTFCWFWNNVWWWCLKGCHVLPLLSYKLKVFGGQLGFFSSSLIKPVFVQKARSSTFPVKNECDSF